MGTPNVSYGTYQPRTPSISSQNTAVLKKFIVNFRRPSDYSGKFGFDWLRDEYIHPIVTVTNDNNGTAIGSPIALCKNTANLKLEYLDGQIYSKDYYPAWLAIFPFTTTSQFAHGSTMHKDGVKLDIEIEEIDSLQQDNTELLFESSNQYLTITPNKLNLNTLLGTKKTKNLSGTTIHYYSASKKVTIKCSGGALNSHAEIKVFAKNGTSPKIEVGKLKVYKNNVIPKAEIVAVNVITNPNQKASLRNDYQYLFKNQSFNQALIRAEVKVDTEFDITTLPTSDTDVLNFLNNNSTMNAEQKRNVIQILYERYGKHRPNSSIDNNANKRTYLFYTDLTAGNTNGICSLDTNTNVWGNHYLIFNSGTSSQTTVVHECGHSFSLPHIFSTSMSKFEFYHGYTDNYMDYNWQKGNRSPNGGFYSSGNNFHSGKMFSFFKWQWEIIRDDRSLIYNY